MIDIILEILEITDSTKKEVLIAKGLYEIPTTMKQAKEQMAMREHLNK